jgi:hypothetical protein
MRLTVIHILVLGGIFALGEVITSLAFPSVRLLGGLLLMFALASPIFRYFHFRPLFLPRCPQCHDRSRSYAISESGWPREVFVCNSCHAATQIWYSRERPSAELLDSSPVLRAQWPYFVGRWRGFASR